MIKIYTFYIIFIITILISIKVLSQTIVFNDNFDTYTVGQQLACQNSTDWKTWRDNPCDTEDPMISNTHFYSGSNSVVIKPANDLVRLHGQRTNGIFKFEFQMYIPTGKTGYFNSLSRFVLGDADGNQKWAIECYFNAGGNGALNAGANLPIAFIFAYDTWHSL